MKIGFYSPYLDTLSGGERYVLTLASYWSKQHAVSLFWDDASIVYQAKSRLNIDLSRVQVVPNVFKTRNFFKKLHVSNGYDLIFFLTDGSIPTTFAKYNILHFQVPFSHIPVHPIKLRRFQAVVCNSEFTKTHIDRRIGRQSVIIYPPVETAHKLQVHKERIILSVGRFSPAKKQHVLIEALKKGKTRLDGYKLVFVGGLLQQDTAFFEKLQREADGLPIHFYPNCSHAKLIEFYNKAHIYWHAAGYKEEKPEMMEHFGITTVEAMSAGCVPIVYNAGGQPEIVRDGDDGFLWVNIDELVEKTQLVLKDKKLYKRMSDAAMERSKRFGTHAFEKSFDMLLEDIVK